MAGASRIRPFTVERLTDRLAQIGHQDLETPQTTLTPSSRPTAGTIGSTPLADLDTDEFLIETPMSGPTSPADLYAVLGVPPDAPQARIDHAYRTLVRRYHPDSRSASEADQATSDDANLRHVMAAYRVIGDPDRRDDYDHRRLNASLPLSVSVRVSTPPNRDSVLVTAGPVYWNPPPSRPTAPPQETLPNRSRRADDGTIESPPTMGGGAVRVQALMAEVDQLRIAIDSNRRIGMAMGILMNQLHMDDEQAFDALRRTSQNTNRKLRDVAEDIIRCPSGNCRPQAG